MLWSEKATTWRWGWVNKPLPAIATTIIFLLCSLLLQKLMKNTSMNNNRRNHYWNWIFHVTRRSLLCWSVYPDESRDERLFSSTFRARTWCSSRTAPLSGHSFSTSSSLYNLFSSLAPLSHRRSSTALHPLLTTISRLLLLIADDWKRKSFYFYDYCGLRER